MMKNRGNGIFPLTMLMIFMMGFALLDLARFGIYSLRSYDEYQEGRTAEMLSYAKLGASLLGHGDAAELDDWLQETSELGHIDFFVVTKDGVPLSSGGTEAEPGASARAGKSGQIIATGRETYLSYHKEGYRLVLGINTSRYGYLLKRARRNQRSLLLDSLVVFLMAFGVVLQSFRDGESEGARPLAEGVKASNSRTRRHPGDLAMPGSHLLSRTHSELESGRPPPYQFGCTMARTDIIHYSRIYSEHPVEEFMGVIDEFLSRSGEVIARYGGYLVGCAGDELICYFKDNEHLDSASVAASAIRDIHAVAEGLHRRTETLRGHPFRLKSALVSGELRFGPRGDGFALSGPVFVATARILSSVEERHQNTVYFPESLAERVSRVSRAVDRGKAGVQGVSGTSPLCEVSEFRPVRSVWESLNGESALLLGCYLNAADTRYGLGQLLHLLSHSGATPAMTLALKAICEARLPYRDERIHRAYRWLLAELIRRCESGSPAVGEELRLLSLAISAARSLIPRNAFDSSLRQLLVRCLGVDDRRVISNAIDTFSHFDPGCKDEPLLELLEYPDNRVLANTLIKLGIPSLDPMVISGLRRMLRSGKSEVIASGAFAIGELARIHFGEDPSLFETHLPFQELLRELSGLGVHPNEMVQRQVRAAIRKAEQPQRELAA